MMSCKENIGDYLEQMGIDADQIHYSDKVKTSNNSIKDKDGHLLRIDYNRVVYVKKLGNKGYGVYTHTGALMCVCNNHNVVMQFIKETDLILVALQ